MAWTKDEVSQAPKTVYTAPEEAYPMVSIIFDPNADPYWSVQYDYIGGPNFTKSDVEEMMGL